MEKQLKELSKDKKRLEKKIKDALIEFTTKNSEMCIYGIDIENILCKIVKQDIRFVSKINVNSKIKLL